MIRASTAGREVGDPSATPAVVGCGASVHALAWSAASSLAAGRRDGIILHVDPSRGSLRELPAPSAVRALSWAPGGGLLAAGYHDGEVRVWIVDAASAVLVGEQRMRSVRAMAWSRRRRNVVVASGPEIEIWAMPANVRVAELRAHRADVTALAWSPDGRTLASAGRDRTVVLWRKTDRTWVEDRVMFGHDGNVSAVAWSRHGRLASLGDDGGVCLWNPWTGTLTARLEGHAPWGGALAWSPTNADLLAVSGADNRVLVWDVTREAKVLVGEGHTGTVLGLAWSPDGATLASGSDDETIAFWASTADRGSEP